MSTAAWRARAGTTALRDQNTSPLRGVRAEHGRGPLGTRAALTNAHDPPMIAHPGDSVRGSGAGDPEQSIELGANDAVALARRPFEARSVQDAHLAARVGDEPPLGEVADRDPHALPCDAQHEREEFLGQVEAAGLGSVVR